MVITIWHFLFLDSKSFSSPNSQLLSCLDPIRNPDIPSSVCVKKEFSLLCHDFILRFSWFSITELNRANVLAPTGKIWTRPDSMPRGFYNFKYTANGRSQWVTPPTIVHHHHQRWPGPAHHHQYEIVAFKRINNNYFWTITLVYISMLGRLLDSVFIEINYKWWSCSDLKARKRATKGQDIYTIPATYTSSHLPPPPPTLQIMPPPPPLSTYHRSHCYQTIR